VGRLDNYKILSMKPVYRYAITGTIIASIIGVGFIFFFVGYNKNKQWNADIDETICNVSSHSVQNKTCSYNCRCTTICTPNCLTTCATCYKPCYDGFIQIYHIVINNQNDENNGTYYKIVWILNRDEKNNVENYLINNYPLKSTLPCYYHDENPEDIFLKLRHTAAFLVMAIIFWSIAFVVLIVYGGYELYNNVYKN